MTTVTLSHLRAVIEGLSLNTPILVRPNDGKEFERWDYDTREAVLVYRAIDDRYGGPVVIIEIGLRSNLALGDRG